MFLCGKWLAVWGIQGGSRLGQEFLIETVKSNRESVCVKTLKRKMASLKFYPLSLSVAPSSGSGKKPEKLK